jgi:hypothetical protein
MQQRKERKSTGLVHYLWLRLTHSPDHGCIALPSTPATALSEPG